MTGFGPVDGSSNLPRATIDHECEYVCYSMRDKGVKKPLKTTEQLVLKIYSDTAGA